MDVELILDLLDAPVCPQRALSNGFNPWEPVVFNEREWRKAKYQREIDQHGQLVTCENPRCKNGLDGEPKQWKVHPLNRNRALACSQACKDVMYRLRKKGQGRPARPVPHKPWEQRRRNTA